MKTIRRQNFRRAVVSWLLVCAMMVGLMPMMGGGVYAVEQQLYSDGEWIYYIVENEVYIFDNLSKDTQKNIVVPNKINGMNVIGVKNSVFAHCSELESVEIQNGIKSLGMGIFEECSSLKTVKIPDSVNEIGYSAFESCSSLSDIVIPNGVKSIGIWTFKGCTNLNSVSIPESVTNIEHESFTGCTNLIEITIPKGVTNIEAHTFEGCVSLKSASIPEGVTGIGYAAFKDCYSLIDLIIPDSVTSIGEAAFENCDNLKSVTIPKTVNSVGSYAFSECDSLEDLNIEGGEMSIGEHSFQGCKSLTNVLIPEGVISIGDYAFSQCVHLKSLKILEGLTSIGRSSFEYCTELTEVSLPNSIQTINSHAFMCCEKLSSIFIPKSIEMIGYQSFWGCDNLKCVEFENGIQKICGYAFNDCKNLCSVIIPESVITIEASAFDYTSSKNRKIYYGGTEDQWDKISKKLYWSDSQIYYHSQNGFVWDHEFYSCPLYCDSIISLKYYGLKDFIASDVVLKCSESEAINFQQAYISDDLGYKRITGIYSGLKEGEYDISISVKGQVSAEIPLTIKKYNTSNISPDYTGSGVLFSLPSTASVRSEASMTKRNTVDLSAKVENGHTVSWNCEGDSISIAPTPSLNPIPDNGSILEYHYDSVKITGKRVGTAIVTCTLDTGEQKNCLVSVESKEEEYDDGWYATVSRNIQGYDSNYKNSDVKKLQKAAIAWNGAYKEYILANKKAVTEYSDDTLEMQARKFMKEHPDVIVFNSSIIPPSEGIKLAVNMAVCDMINSSAAKKIDFSNIKTANPSSLASQVVNSIRSSMESPYISQDYNGIHVEMNCFGTAGIFTGYFSCDSHSGAINSDISECSDAIADYIEQLKELEENVQKSAWKGALMGCLQEALDDTVSSVLTKKFIDKLKKLDYKYRGEINKIGLGDIYQKVNTCFSYYNKYINPIQNINSDAQLDNVKKDIEMIDNALYEFKDKDDIEDQLVGAAFRKLLKAQENLTNMLKTYEKDGNLDWYGIKSKLGIACPVSVSIYDSNGTQLGYVGPDDIWYTDDIYIEEVSESYMVYTYIDDKLRYEVTGTKDGTVSCYYEEWKDDAPVGRVNYYDMPVSEGTPITMNAVPKDVLTDASAITLSVDGEDKPADDYLSSDQVASISVFAYEEGEAGSVLGGGTYVKGDPVVLYAVPNDDSFFLGWYRGDTLVSVNAAYEFAALQDTGVTARFMKKGHSLENELIQVSDEYKDDLSFETIQDGDQFTLSIHANDQELQSQLNSFSVILAHYEADGKMDSVEYLNGTAIGDGMTYDATVKDRNYQLMILDGQNQPVIESYSSAG